MDHENGVLPALQDRRHEPLDEGRPIVVILGKMRHERRGRDVVRVVQPHVGRLFV